jgi:hypothetical protein
MKKTILAILALLLLVTSCNYSTITGCVDDYLDKKPSVTVETFKGDKVTGVDGSCAESTKSLTVTWNPVKGADCYFVERAIVDEVGDAVPASSWCRLEVMPKTNRIVDDYDLEPDKVYAYRVKAVSLASDAAGVYSDVAYAYLLSAPHLFNASNGLDTYVNLNWSESRGVEGYLIRYTYLENDNYLDGWNEFSASSSRYFPANAGEARFLPLEGKGGLVRFVINAVGKGGVLSAPSAVVSGSVKVPGAPDKPSALAVSQGDYADKVIITWTAPGAESTFRVLRSEEGATAETLTDSAKPAFQDGNYTFIDTTAKAGVLYTYQVMGIGSIVNEDGEAVPVTGEPAEKKGYRLSPPTVITNLGFNEAANGFTFTIKPAVGVSAHEGWTYKIYAKANETDSFSFMSEVEAGAEDITIDTDFLSDGLQYFDIRTFDGENESDSYRKTTGKNIYVPVPALENLSVSRNAVNGEADAEGFYPVSLSVEGNPFVKNSFDITIIDRSNNSEYLKLEGKVLDADRDNLMLTSAFTSAKPGVEYQVKLSYTDILGRKCSTPLTASGYSAITDQLFKDIWVSASFKPWQLQDYVPDERKAYWTRKTSDSIWYYIDCGNSSSLSTQLNALTDGKWVWQNDISTRSGKVGYSASREGLGGAIYFKYENFGEQEYMWTSGDYEMHVDASGTGKCTQNSGFDVYGMYPGKITFEKITVKSKDFEGYYTVKQEGRPSSEVAK